LILAASLVLAATPLPYESEIARLKVLPAGCTSVKIHVDGAAKKGGDGSANAPFVTVGEAVAAGEKLQPCAMTAVIAPGKYAEGTVVTRIPTVIAGATKDVTLQMAFEPLQSLIVSGLTLADVKTTPVAATFKAALVFLGVNFLNPGRHAVRQHGGTLTMSDVQVRGVWTWPDDPSSGSAIHLTGGVQAELTTVRLSGNVRGIYAAGAGTRVTANYVTIEDTTIHPSRIEAITAARSCSALGFQYLGAVEVDAGAELLGGSWRIARSKVAGLYAHDGGRARLTRVEIDATEAVSAELCGGFGAIVHRGGTIDLNGVAVTHSALCGVVVGPAAGTAMDLHDGYVDFTPVGICMQQEGYNIMRLRDRVEYRSGVVAPLQSTHYSLPDAL
jgi:hypothetical protein